MPSDLERERDRLLDRLAGLERQHAALVKCPQDREGHARHHQELLEYQVDVRLYRERLTTAERPAHVQASKPGE